MPSRKSGMMQRKCIQTLKRIELTTIKLPLVFETCNWLNIIGWVGRI